MALTESQIEAKLKIAISRLGGKCIKLLSNHLNGLPDRICLLPGGRIVFVELKAEGKKPRKLQLKIHEKLRDLGFRVEVISSGEQINAFITTL